MNNPLKSARAWFRKLSEVVADYDRRMKAIREWEIAQEQEICHLRATVKHGVQFIKDATSIHADVHSRPGSASQIIVCGRYRKGDYVHVYEICEEDMGHLVGMLREMERFGKVRTIDAAPGIRGMFDRDFETKDRW